LKSFFVVVEEKKNPRYFILQNLPESIWHENKCWLPTLYL